MMDDFFPLDDDDFDDDFIVSDSDIDVFDDYAAIEATADSVADNDGVIVVSRIVDNEPSQDEIKALNSLLFEQKPQQRPDNPIDYSALPAPSKEQVRLKRLKKQLVPKPSDAIKEALTKAPDSSTFEGSIGRIGAYRQNLTLEKPVPKPIIDQELQALAFDNDIFNLQDAPDDKVVSPKLSEFIAQYYRLINVIIHKITLNQMIQSQSQYYGIWDETSVDDTPTLAQAQFFTFDVLYRHCVDNRILKSLRINYDDKVIHFSKMSVYDVMGAGKGISSAKQAAYYLERMANVALSTTITYLSHKKMMAKTRQLLESLVVDRKETLTDETVQMELAEHRELLSSISEAVERSSRQQVLDFKDDKSVYIRGAHHCLLFAKRFLNIHSNIQLANSHLRGDALTCLLSGLSTTNTNLSKLGFRRLLAGVKDSPELQNSLVSLAYRSHRHCYPINELSALK